MGASEISNGRGEGFFNVLVGISTLNADVQVFIAQKLGKWSANVQC